MKPDINHFGTRRIVPPPFPSNEGIDPVKVLGCCGIMAVCTLVVFFLLVRMANKAHAEPVTQAQLREACDYAAAKMHVKSLPLPLIVQDSQKFYDVARTTSEGRINRIQAIYLIGRIYVLPTFNSSFMPYLVHECVHHAQIIAAIKYPCHAAREREAYQIQNQYSRERGTRVLINDEQIEKLSNCKQENHP